MTRLHLPEFYFRQILLIALIALSGGMSSCEKEEASITNYPLSPADHFTPDEYGIYSIALNNYSDSTIVVIQTTNFKSNLTAGVSERLKTHSLFDESLKSNYVKNNDKEYYLGNYFNLQGKSNTLYSAEKFNRMIGNGGDPNLTWENYYVENPGSKGIFSLNRIGFNNSNNSAVVEVTRHKQQNDSTIDIYYLEKIEGRWTLVEVLEIT